MSEGTVRGCLTIIEESLGLLRGSLSEGRKRHRDSWARAVAVTIMVEEFPNMALRSIGRALGLADHSTVSYYYKRGAVLGVREWPEYKLALRRWRAFTASDSSTCGGFCPSCGTKISEFQPTSPRSEWLAEAAE